MSRSSWNRLAASSCLTQPLMRSHDQMKITLGLPEVQAHPEEDEAQHQQGLDLAACGSSTIARGHAFRFSGSGSAIDLEVKLGHGRQGRHRGMCLLGPVVQFAERVAWSGSSRCLMRSKDDLVLALLLPVGPVVLGEGRDRRDQSGSPSRNEPAPTVVSVVVAWAITAAPAASSPPVIVIVFWR